MISSIRRSVAVLTVAAASLGAAAAASSPAGAVDYGSSARRVIATNFPDPGFGKFTTRAQGTKYYVYATGMRVARSASPQGGYTVIGNAMPTRPSWVSPTNPSLWAPEVFQTSATPGVERFTMYFSGRYRNTGNNCVGVATSNSPTGPFTASGSPLICPPAGYMEAIDASEYTSRYGNRYLLYKIGNYSPRRFQIMAVRMDNNRGTTRAGSTVTILSASSVGSAVAEAPKMFRDGSGRVWLFVSRNGYKDCSYATQAWSGSDMTSLTNRGYVRGIGTSTTDRFCGPGGASVIKDGSTYRVAFHHRYDASPLLRNAWVGSLGFDSAGAYLR
jgi:hypothetical protein